MDYTHENVLFAIEILVFLATITVLVWRLSAKFGKVTSELERLDSCVVDIQRTDERQDNAINRVEQKTTNIDKQLAIVATQTDSIKDATTSISDKLDRLIEKMNK